VANLRVVGSHAEQRFGVSALARTLAYGGALTPGSLLAVVVSTFNNNITVTVADDVNGAYTQAGPYAINGAVRLSIWYFPNNASSGTPTVTVTPSASAYVSLAIDEYTGPKTVAPLRASATSTGSGGGSMTVGPVGAAGTDLVLAGLGTSSTVPLTSVDAPFALITALNATAAFEGIMSACDVNAPGNESAVFRTSGVIGQWAGAIAAFEAEVVVADRLMTNFVTDMILLRNHVAVPYGEQ
jgi:hypothetical protein